MTSKKAAPKRLVRSVEPELARSPALEERPYDETADDMLLLLAESNGADESDVLLGGTSNDPYNTAGELWGMAGDESTPANRFGSQAAEAWAAGHTGSMKVAVGVVDSGIDYTHIDLFLNVFLNQAEIPAGIRGLLVDTDGDQLITFRDLNADANAGRVVDYNRNGRIDGGDLLDDRSGWEDRADADGNGFTDDLIGWNFVKGTNDPFDDHGHGSHVSGTIGATGGNGIGVAGVNWAVQIVPMKTFSARGTASPFDNAAAVDYFTGLSRSNTGARFVATNNSYGGSRFNTSMRDAINRAAQADILFITAAGNGAKDIDALPEPVYPAGYDTTAAAGYDAVIAVAATTSTGGLWRSSNWGQNLVDLAAPGHNIASTVPGNRYQYWQGTSMATPHVTGAVALYASVHADASAARIRDDLLATVTAARAVADKTASGGRLDVEQFIEAGGGAAVEGGAGDDSLVGGDDADIMYGKGGADTLIGGAGDDVMYGGSGNDVYHVESAGDEVTELAAQGRDTARAWCDYTLPADVEVLELAGNAALQGVGNALDNTIVGNAGANRLSGLDGDDVIRGGEGADTIEGGAGADKLMGGAGRDFLIGGSGADVFDYAATGESAPNAPDTIVDFERGVDRIDLYSIDATRQAAGNDAFVFIGPNAFSGTAGELRAEERTGHTLVQADVNGDGLSDFDVLVLNLTARLSAADFVL